MKSTSRVNTVSIHFAQPLQVLADLEAKTAALHALEEEYERAVRAHNLSDKRLHHELRQVRRALYSWWFVWAMRPPCTLACDMSYRNQPQWKQHISTLLALYDTCTST